LCGDAGGHTAVGMGHTTAEGIARVGLAARGVFFAVLAALALQLAFGAHNENASGQGAIEAVARQPMGTVLLLVLAAGFAAYAGWQLIKGIRGDGWRERVGDLVRGSVWTALSAMTLRRVLGAGSSGQQEESITAAVLNLPFGPALVAAAGLALIGVAIGVAVRTRDPDPYNRLRTDGLDDRVERTVRTLGRIGAFARVVLFALGGAFLFRAAVTHDPNQGVGLDGALREVAQAPYGPYALSLVAAGLVAYSLWSFARSRYERIPLE
jgi:hypothetical protein